MMVLVEGNTVMFRVQRPQVPPAALAGDLSLRQTRECQMVREPGGKWFACIRRPEGDLPFFRFHADGAWLSDTGNHANSPWLPLLNGRIRVDADG